MRNSAVNSQQSVRNGVEENTHNNRGEIPEAFRLQKTKKVTEEIKKQFRLLLTIPISN